jgi:hypothetical protein
MINYHRNIHGRYAVCDARIRGCRYGGTHISQASYDQLVEKNDPTVSPLKSKIHYVQEADKEYQEAVKNLHKNQQMGKQLTQDLERISKKHKISLTSYPANSEEVKEEIFENVKQAYLDAGVHPVKAQYLVQEMKDSGAENFTPVVRKRADKYDPDLAAKTVSAKTAIENSENHKALLKKFTDRKDAQKRYRDVYAEYDAIANERKVAAGIPGQTSRSVLEKDVERAKQKLAVKQNWERAGVPTNAETGSLKNIKQVNVSTDDGFKINNVWVQDVDGKVERVTGYGEPVEGSVTSGYFVTASGRKLQQKTHYHSFREEITGNKDTIIFGERSGRRLAARQFTLTYSIYSSD